MLDLGNDFNEKEEIVGGGFKEYPCKGYALQIQKIEKRTMGAYEVIAFDTEIADGEFKGAFGKYPKSLNVFLGKDDSSGRLKGVFMTIIKENLSMFPEVKELRD